MKSKINSQNLKINEELYSYKEDKTGTFFENEHLDVVANVFISQDLKLGTLPLSGQRGDSKGFVEKSFQLINKHRKLFVNVPMAELKGQ